MHEVIYSIREIPTGELPTVHDERTGETRVATREELLDMGIAHVVDDYYSCAEQIVSDDVADVVPDARGVLQRTWRPRDGRAHPGIERARGGVVERYLKLPPDVQGRVLKAHVYRATKKTVNAKELLAPRLAARIRKERASRGELAAEETRQLELEEAARLAQDPDNGVAFRVVSIDEVDDARDIVIAQDIIPHRWQGER